VRGNFWLGLAAGFAAFHVGGYLAERPFPTRPRADKENKVADYIAWRQVTAWVADHTPSEAIFLTPRNQQTFKWYTGRAEVVTWKDVPQDAASIVAWWERVQDVHRTTADEEVPGVWRRSLAFAGEERLRSLGKKYGASYLLTESRPRLALPLVYLDNGYAVYRLQ
jgi:hypothetical protein